MAGFSRASNRDFQHPCRDHPGYYFAVLTVLLQAVFVTLNLMRSRVGCAFMAIREHDIAARAMGVDLVRWKLQAFMVSAFYTGVAGALLAFYSLHLWPE